MRLFYTEEKIPKEKLENIAATPVGRKTAGQILGFSGVLFRLPDVYVSDKLEIYLTHYPEFSAVIKELIMKIYREEYGEVSQDENCNNGELRWLCGAHEGMVARYNTEAGTLCFKSFGDFALFYFSDENINNGEEEESCRKKPH